MRERRDETEFAQSRCHERMHGTHHGAASQKIHAAAAQLAGARSGKDETPPLVLLHQRMQDRKSTRLNSSHVSSSYAVFCLKKKKHTVSTDLPLNRPSEL